MMHRSLVLAIAIVSLFAATLVRAEDKLRIATEGAYPPFNFLNAKGEPEGFDVDIANALCKEMSVSCTIVAEPWVSILDGLRDRRYDVIVASMVQTPERDKVADFTDHYYRSRSIFVGRKELVTSKGAENLAGKRIGTAKATIQAAYLAENFAKKSTVIVYDDTAIQLEKLVGGEVDAILADTLTGFDFLKTEKGKNFDFIGEALPLDDVSSEARIAVREGDARLKDALDKALQSIRLDGTYDRINRKYFPFSVY
jgi:polar amino acid transport system substrate-binding protein